MAAQEKTQQMTNNLWLTGLALVAAAGAAAQTPEAPAFDAASVKVSPTAPTGPPGGGRGFFGGRGNIQASPGSLTMRNVTLKNAIRWAYHVSEYQVSGPDWLDSARYNIMARAAAPADEEQLQLMLQRLLAERFKLVLHRQSKELQVYVLLPGKNGIKLQESTSTGEGSIENQPDRMSVVVQRTPISQMIDLLTPLLGAPVLDMTGLKGKYDITVNLADYMADMQSAGGAPSDPLTIIKSALEEKLGLKLESRKMPLDVLVVESAEKIPTEN
jgi:uncharacterized protein (TIGR03435 family)